ncbi:MAG: FAD-binding oxidoreductase [Chloroflexi bacterium]|nr:FAD-binding oxidoreductase [Chloroflexota bacterium]
MNLITPQIIDNVQRTLARASADGLRLSPRGGNTSQDRFLPPADVDIALDLTQLNRVVEYEPANLTITVEAGMTLAALQSHLRAQRQFLPLDPPLAERATIGGVLAANAHGPLRFRYGTARDWLLGTRVVLADGTIIKGGGRVVKNVAGYDMPKLFIGSLGTLGVIAEATFKLSPLPPASRTLIATCETPAAATAALTVLMRGTPPPSAVEIVDAASARAVLLEAGSAPWAVVVQFASLPATLERQAKDFAALCVEKELTIAATFEGADEEPLWTRIRNLPATLANPDAAIIEMRVLPTQAAEAAGRLQTLASQSGVDCAVFVRAGQAVWAALRGDPAAVVQTIATARDWRTARQGYLVVQRLPDALRGTLDVWGPTRADFAVMQHLKAQFDPLNLLNPGIFAGGL